MSRKIYAFAAILTLCLGACAPGHNNYSHFFTLPANGWAYSDTLTFLPSMDDSVATGNVAIAVRHSAVYPYANLWLEISSDGDPLAGMSQICDTVNIRLCDRTGRWLGRGMGVSFQISDTLHRHYTLADSVPLYVRHIMRVDTLYDIEQIGLIFVPDKR